MSEGNTTLAEFPWAAKYPGDVDWGAEIPEKTLVAALAETVSRVPDRPAMYFMGKAWTYRELGGLVDRAARGLQDMGVERRTRVGLLLPNLPYFVILYYAILKAGGVVVNFNPLYAPQELARQIEDSGAEYMAAPDLQAVYPQLAKAMEQAPLKKVIVCPMADVLPFPKNLLYPLVKRSDVASIPEDDVHVSFRGLTKNDGSYREQALEPGDLAVLQYTGGTTGTSKGAMLSHANLYTNACQCQRWFVDMVYGEEVMLGVLPFFHVFGMTVAMNLGIIDGSEILLVPRWDTKDVLDLIEKKSPTLFPGVPTMYTAVNHDPEAPTRDLSSIKFCISGGAPLPMEVKRRFEELTGCRLVEGYGLTESSPVATCNPFYGESKEGSIGIPMPRTVIEIHSLDDSATSVPLGDRGEVCIRGPQVMMGYWQRPEETEEILVDGLLRTGDVGYMDNDGYTFIVDRIKDLILAGGYNVYPRMIEEAIYQHPAVAEVTVVGVPDEYRGERPKAFVKLREGESLTAEQLIHFLEDKLSKIEMPKDCEFRDDLPKTMVGKLSKKELAAEEKERAGGSGQKDESTEGGSS